MADLTVTGTQVGNARPQMAVVIPMIASVAIDKGEVVYPNNSASGQAALADASAAGTAIAIGVSLTDAGVGQPIDVLVMGFVSGFDLSSVNYGTLLSLSDTAGAIDNGAGTPTVAAPIGRVVGLSDGDNTKVIFVNCLYNLCVLPA